MSGFDYGNARLRAMKSRLLSRSTLEELCQAGSVQGLITALVDTAYREAVQAELVRLTGMECLAAALRNDLVATLGNARRFFTGSEGELAALVLRRYDVHNLKTVLRGLARQAPANEILAGILPIGDLRSPDLTELARTADVRAAIDLIATWRLPAAQPLLDLRAARPGAELFDMEVVLDRWHFHRAFQGVGREDTVLSESLTLEADIANIMTALRLVGAPESASILRDRFGADSVTALFVGPESVLFALLVQVARQELVPRAIELLAGTRYGPTLVSASEAYAASHRLSVFERALMQQRLLHAAGLIVRDPLGIGVLLGYVALKTNEVANIRAITQGLMLAEKPDRIQAELMFA